MIYFAGLLPLLGVCVGLWFLRRVDTRKRTRSANIRLFIVALIVMELVIIVGMGFIVRSLITNPPKLYRDDLGDRPALTLQDFDITSSLDPEHSGTMIKGSVAVPDNYSYWETAKGGNLNTEVYRSVSSVLARKLYEHFAVEFLKQYERFDIVRLDSGEAAVWGADEGITSVYLDHTVELLLLRGKRILRLSIYIEGLSVEEAGEAVQRLWDD